MTELEKDPLMKMLGYKEEDTGFQGRAPLRTLIEPSNEEKELAHNRIDCFMNQEAPKSTIERDARRLGVNVEELRSLFHTFAYEQFVIEFSQFYRFMRLRRKGGIFERPRVEEIMKYCEITIFNQSYLATIMAMKQQKKVNRWT